MPRKRSFSMKDQSAGPPSPGEFEYLAVGQLRRPHGVRGEILMAVWTDFPERLEPGVKVYAGDDHQAVQIRTVRSHSGNLLISFDEFHNREQVGTLRNQVLMVRADDRPDLEDGELYLHQLIGLKVIDDHSNECLGQIAEIIETGANDVYIVRSDSGRELLLPAIDPVVLNIDLERVEMRVRLLPGL
ncbi:MAG: ribosome maturation factor RimM [Anaerolineales bacterium]|jgi:16S rRNA processing protein RimM|nr:ribosome maturation factor RimM [Anaerolineales bacterium]